MIRILLVTLLACCSLALLPQNAVACSSTFATGWGAGEAARVSASCGQSQVQAPVSDAVKKTGRDPGTSTNAIPAEAPVPQPMVKTCDDLVENCPTIPEPAVPVAPVVPGAAPMVTTDMLREAAARLTLPPVAAKVGPDPSVNQWGIVAVGYPIWLWTPGPDRLDTTVTAQGITITIAAARINTTFDMGDGTTIGCRTMTPYPGPVSPPAESPTCGYRYTHLPDSPGAGYTVRATSHWNITWTALGQTGSFTMTRAATRHLDVAEIQTVIVAR